ncbi:CHAT domain-containing protein, partial [bacterium]|nr:CHAT domain-containing protein [bacterium]
MADQENSDVSKLLQQADDDFSNDRYGDSIPKYQQAIKLLEQQNDRKALADASYKIAFANVQIGNYAEGQRFYAQALKLHEELGDKAAAGMDLTRLAGVDSNQGNYKSALDLAHKALKIHEAVGSKKGSADTFRLMGSINDYQGNSEEALKYVQQASEIYTAINDIEGLAKCYSSFGGIYWKQGKLDEALDQYKKGLQIGESLNKKDLISKAWGNIGLVYWNQGDTEKAFESYKKSQEIAHEIGAKQTECLNLFNIGILHQEGGNYKESQESYQKSLELAKEIGDRGTEGVCYEGLGKIHKIFADYDVALEYFDKSLKIAEEIGEQRAAAYALKAIGEVYELQDNPKIAIEYLQKARGIYEKMGEKRGIGMALDEIGELYLNVGKHDLALNNLNEALRIYESIGAKSEMPGTYRMIGLAQKSKKDLEEADASFSKSIQIAKETDQPDQLWQSLYCKGEMLRDSGKEDEALQAMKESIVVLERIRGEVDVAELRAGYFQDKVMVYTKLIQLLIAKQNLPEAFEYVQRSKARGFLDMLAEARINQESILNADLRDKKKETETNLRKIHQSIQTESEKEVVDRSKIATFEKQRNGLELEYSNLILEIRKQNPEYADIQYPQPLKLSDAQSLLDPQSVLLEYSIGDSESWVFAITADTAAAFELPPQKKLAEQVHEFREVLLKPDATFQTLEQAHSKYVTQAQTLYSELIHPAESIMKGKQRLLLAPDGTLSYLPFESLLTKTEHPGTIHFESLPYLVRDYDVYYVPSVSVLASVLKNHHEKNNQPKQLLALADPWLKNAGGEIAKVRGWGTLGPLPNARTEVQNIASLYPKDQVTVFEGKQASEKNLKQADLQEYKRIHFASHGLIDEEKPEFSALVLSSDEKGSEDGYLTMREVFDLKLNADLVVLSACKTGLGKEVRGEGVTGISRAFLCAGTPSVLVSLWDVYDKSTADFMASFYKNMETKNMNKSAALREARLQMISSKKFSHPYYWAPFVLIGNK